MNAKNMIVQHKKKGAVKLGSLSHNEMCRVVVELMGTNRQLQMTLKQGWETYQNHLASIDALEDCNCVQENYGNCSVHPK